MWGLYTWKVLLGDTIFYFSEDTNYLTWGLITTILILKLLSQLSRLHEKQVKDLENMDPCGFCVEYYSSRLQWFFTSVLHQSYPLGLTDLFWDYYSLQFAFIGCFIAGIFAIIDAFTK